MKLFFSRSKQDECVDSESQETVQLIPAQEPEESIDAQPEYVPQQIYTEDGPTVVLRPVYKRHLTIKILALVGKFLLGLVLAAAVLVVGLFGYLTAAEYTPAFAETAVYGGVDIQTPLGSSEEDKASGESLFEHVFTLATFNTGYAGLDRSADYFMDGGSQVRPDSEDQVLRNMKGIREILSALNADFLFLQEVDTDSDRSFEQNQWIFYETQLDTYESRFALNYSCDYVPNPALNGIGKVQSGIVTMSRYNTASATRYQLPCPFSWPTRVVNYKRCLLVTRIPLGEEGSSELVLVNLHLEDYDDGEGRLAQTRQLMDFVQAEYAKGNYVIAGGDFNQVFPGAYYTKAAEQWEPGLLEELPEGWRYAYDDRTPTCRLLNQPYREGNAQTYVVDGFIVSPNIAVHQVETLDEGFFYSSHNPVLMRFSLGDVAGIVENP